MEDKIKISMMLDYYKELLTDKQADIMELYFDKDLSLAEISELTNTSRQAIYDLIKRGSKILQEYEEKLGLMKNSMEYKGNKRKIVDKLDVLEKMIIDDYIKEQIMLIKKDINRL